MFWFMSPHPFLCHSREFGLGLLLLVASVARCAGVPRLCRVHGACGRTWGGRLAERVTLQLGFEAHKKKGHYSVSIHFELLISTKTKIVLFIGFIKKGQCNLKKEDK